MLLLFLTLLALPSTDWQRWLEEEVVYIISAREKKEFESLTTDAQRERFVEDFWRWRDPDPSTAVNEFKLEHERRIRHANERFNNEGVPGWKTLRGRTYIIHGAPDSIDYSYGYLQKVPVYSPTRVLNPLGEALPFVYVEFPTPESETWLYRHLPGAQSTRSFFTVIFAKMDPQELYSLERFISRTPTSVPLNETSPGVGQRLLVRDQLIKEFITKQSYFRADYRIVYAGGPQFHDLEDLFKAVFEARGPELNQFSVQQASADLLRSPGELLEEIWDRRRRMEEMVTSEVFFGSLEVGARVGFLSAPEGEIWIPFLAEVGFGDGGRPKEVDLLVELVDRNTGRVVAQLQDKILGSSGNAGSGRLFYQSRLGAAAGSYHMRILVSDLSGRRIGLWEKDVEAPRLGAEGFGAGPLLLCDKVMPIADFAGSAAGFGGWSSEYGRVAPLALDDRVFVPSLSPRFRRGESLTTLIEVYNPTLADGKPEVSMEAFFRRAGRDVLAVPARTLDYLTGRKGKTILYAFVLPLRRLDFGDYDFVVRLTDLPSGAMVERSTPVEIW